MNIHLENVDIKSTSGPNHFASKLIKYMPLHGAKFQFDKTPDARLCFIETHRNELHEIPIIQRLDGIYFNTEQPYRLQNSNIEKTYNNSKGVVFQSEFNKRLTKEYFGSHENSAVIHNGADVEYINKVTPLQNKLIEIGIEN